MEMVSWESVFMIVWSSSSAICFVREFKVDCLSSIIVDIDGVGVVGGFVGGFKDFVAVVVGIVIVVVYGGGDLRDGRVNEVLCLCKEGATMQQAITRTSWTSANPGRRFYGCPDEGSSCRWIGWYDPKMCARSRMIIPGLLRGRNELEEILEVSQCDV
ncbi:zinc finger, GRF-type [Artemisia annua]|uniref:Zinc finger, GRF-type n=1 Tax=Artemisia annua TaxID=35608 RepID=A0A2U1KSR1_ARTAN|nr:zinc finger, GRF-type [Artemisia annua]